MFSSKKGGVVLRKNVTHLPVMRTTHMAATGSSDAQSGTTIIVRGLFTYVCIPGIYSSVHSAVHICACWVEHGWRGRVFIPIVSLWPVYVPIDSVDLEALYRAGQLRKGWGQGLTLLKV